MRDDAAAPSLVGVPTDLLADVLRIVEAQVRTHDEIFNLLNAGLDDRGVRPVTPGAFARWLMLVEPMVVGTPAPRKPATKTKFERLNQDLQRLVLKYDAHPSVLSDECVRRLKDFILGASQPGIAPDRSIVAMQQAAEAVRRGEFVELPSPHRMRTKGIEERDLQMLLDQAFPTPEAKRSCVEALRKLQREYFRQQAAEIRIQLGLDRRPNAEGYPR